MCPGPRLAYLDCQLRLSMMRQRILEVHPWVAVSLMDAFECSKAIAIDRLRAMPPTLMVFGGQYLRELDDVFGRDPYPYGIKAAARAFDMPRRSRSNRACPSVSRRWTRLFRRISSSARSAFRILDQSSSYTLFSHPLYPGT
jgi:hypothetical protein